MTLIDQPLMLGARTRWVRLAARDRAIIIGVLAVLAAALLYLTLWLPATSGIAEVSRELGDLRAEHGHLEEMAAEARRLRGASAHDLVLAPDQRVVSVARAIERAGLSGPPPPEIVSDETGAVVVRWADVDYAGWVTWLGRAELELGASAFKVAISELPTASGAGHVRAEVTLRWQDKKKASASAAGESH